MCYGQTGAGKTFSMLGLSNNFKQRGVVPRAIQDVYHQVSQKFDQAIKIRVSYVEIYNNTVSYILLTASQMVDLLASPEYIGKAAKALAIQDDSRGGVAVKNMSMIHCLTEEDALE
jgi:kinesin family member 6/9